MPSDMSRGQQADKGGVNVGRDARDINATYIDKYYAVSQALPPEDSVDDIVKVIREQLNDRGNRYSPFSLNEERMLQLVEDYAKSLTARGGEHPQTWQRFDMIILTIAMSLDPRTAAGLSRVHATDSLIFRRYGWLMEAPPELLTPEQQVLREHVEGESESLWEMARSRTRWRKIWVSGGNAGRRSAVTPRKDQRAETPSNAVSPEPQVQTTSPLVTRKRFVTELERLGYFLGPSAKDIYYDSDQGFRSPTRIAIRGPRIRIEKVNKKTFDYDLWQSFSLEDESDFALETLRQLKKQVT